MKYLDIIKAPVVTEKSALLNEKNEYAFFVDVKANKTEIKDAIEKLFNVKVKEIRTINVHPRKEELVVIQVLQIVRKSNCYFRTRPNYQLRLRRN